MRYGFFPNPSMASSVNRRTASGGSVLLLPRRYNRTAVDRLAYGCKGLSPNGVSVSLHQTLIQGSAALARGPRRLRDRYPTPKKLIRTPTPALQNGGLILARSPSYAAAGATGLRLLPRPLHAGHGPAPGHRRRPGARPAPAARRTRRRLLPPAG